MKRARCFGKARKRPLKHSLLIAAMWFGTEVTLRQWGGAALRDLKKNVSRVARAKSARRSGRSGRENPSKATTHSMSSRNQRFKIQKHRNTLYFPHSGISRSSVSTSGQISPIDLSSSVLFQVLVRQFEMVVSHESAVRREWRRVSRSEDQVLFLAKRSVW